MPAAAANTAKSPVFSLEEFTHLVSASFDSVGRTDLGLGHHTPTDPPSASVSPTHSVFEDDDDDDDDVPDTGNSPRRSRNSALSLLRRVKSHVHDAVHRPSTASTSTSNFASVSATVSHAPSAFTPPRAPTPAFTTRSLSRISFKPASPPRHPHQPSLHSFFDSDSHDESPPSTPSRLRVRIPSPHAPFLAPRTPPLIPVATPNNSPRSTASDSTPRPHIPDHSKQPSSRSSPKSILRSRLNVFTGLHSPSPSEALATPALSCSSSSPAPSLSPISPLADAFLDPYARTDALAHALAPEHDPFRRGMLVITGQDAPRFEAKRRSQQDAGGLLLPPLAERHLVHSHSTPRMSVQSDRPTMARGISGSDSSALMLTHPPVSFPSSSTAMSLTFPLPPAQHDPMDKNRRLSLTVTLTTPPPGPPPAFPPPVSPPPNGPLPPTPLPRARHLSVGTRTRKESGARRGGNGKPRLRREDRLLGGAQSHPQSRLSARRRRGVMLKAERPHGFVGLPVGGSLYLSTEGKLSTSEDDVDVEIEMGEGIEAVQAAIGAGVGFVSVLGESIEGMEKVGDVVPDSEVEPELADVKERTRRRRNIVTSSESATESTRSSLLTVTSATTLDGNATNTTSPSVSCTHSTNAALSSPDLCVERDVDSGARDTFYSARSRPTSATDLDVEEDEPNDVEKAFYAVQDGQRILPLPASLELSRGKRFILGAQSWGALKRECEEGEAGRVVIGPISKPGPDVGRVEVRVVEGRKGGVEMVLKGSRPSGPAVVGSMRALGVANGEDGDDEDEGEDEDSDSSAKLGPSRIPGSFPRRSMRQRQHSRRQRPSGGVGSALGLEGVPPLKSGRIVCAPFVCEGGGSELEDERGEGVEMGHCLLVMEVRTPVTLGDIVRRAGGRGVGEGVPLLRMSSMAQSEWYDSS